MTNEQLAQLIATLISDFIRPNSQQHLESMARIDRIEGLLERHAEVIAGIDIKLDQLSTITQEVAQNQKAATERMNRFDERLEETRRLVAKNASDIAKLTVKQDRNSDLIEANAQRIADNAQQVTALAEASHTQLAGIISNSNRISRLEQQAS